MIGTRIGNYRIVERIPGGGMAQVYRAVQLSLNRTVVIKVPRPELADSPEHVARFRREAETLAQLEHEGIVRIYDIEEHAGRLFIVMEDVAGGSLEQLLGGHGRLEPGRAREVAVEIADALAAAHGRGIIHRDVKPGNILFSATGRPKLADFGIARMLNAATSTGSQLLGTPHYMSPEQVRGETLSPASDVYSLGIVLYEMLTGEVPFDAQTPFGVAMKHIQERPRPLLQLARDVPASLSQVVHRALEKDPALRYASAPELRDHLLRCPLAAPRGSTSASTAEPGPAEAACPDCGAPVEHGFLTCPRCGSALPVTCGCGAVAEPWSASCPACRTGAPPPFASASRGKSAGVGTAPAIGAAIAGRLRELRALAGRAIEEIGAPWGLARGRRVRRPSLPAALAGGGLILLVSGALTAAWSAFYAADRNEPVLFDLPPAAMSAPAPAAPSGSVLAPVDRAFVEPPPGSDPVPSALDPHRDDPSSPERGRIRREDAGPADGRNQREPPSRPGPATPASSSNTPQRETPLAPAERKFDAVQARREILQIIERQRVATERGDLAALLQDVAPELHASSIRAIRGMHRGTREIRSEVSEATVDVRSPDRADASFHVRLSAVLERDGRSQELARSTVSWELSRIRGRWIITRATEPKR